MLDVAIVGAGPAGLGCRDLVRGVRPCRRRFTTSKAAPGGQIYRGITRQSARAARDPRRRLLARRVAGGAVPCVRAPATCRRRRCGRSRGATTVTFAVAITAGPPHAPTTLTCDARAVILATGAQERPFPIPGWTLPGVMHGGRGADPAQDRGHRAAGGTVLAGGGPLLWLVASQLLRRRRDDRCAARHDAARPARARRSRMRRRSCRRRISLRAASSCGGAAPHPRRRARRESLAGAGTTRRRACASRVDGKRTRSPVDQLLLHQGVVPDVNLAGAAGCALAWNDLQACFEPVVDDWGGNDGAGPLCRGRRRRHRGRRGRRSAGPARRAGGRQRARPHRQRRTRPRSAPAPSRKLPMRNARPRVPRRAVPSRRRVPRSRGRHARVPLRGSDRRRDRATRARADARDRTR